MKIRILNDIDVFGRIILKKGEVIVAKRIASGFTIGEQTKIRILDHEAEIVE